MRIVSIEISSFRNIARIEQVLISGGLRVPPCVRDKIRSQNAQTSISRYRIEPGKRISCLSFPLTSVSNLPRCRLRLSSRSMHQDRLSRNIEQLAPISASDSVTAAVFQDRGIKCWRRVKGGARYAGNGTRGSGGGEGGGEPGTEDAIERPS